MEPIRKLIHLSGCIFPILYLLTPSDKAHYFVLSFALFATIVIITDFLRIYNKKVGEFIDSIFGNLMRDHEKKGLTTTSFYFLGSILVVVFFSRKIAITSLLILSISDVAAAIVGMYWGKRRMWGKSMEGSFSFLLSSFFITFLFFPKKALFVALISTFAEFFTPGKFDNLTIPLASALALKFF